MQVPEFAPPDRVQLMPAGDEPTMPAPFPASVRVKVFRALNVAETERAWLMVTEQVEPLHALPQP